MAQKLGGPSRTSFPQVLEKGPGNLSLRLGQACRDRGFVYGAICVAGLVADGPPPSQQPFQSQWAPHPHSHMYQHVCQHMDVPGVCETATPPFQPPGMLPGTALEPGSGLREWKGRTGLGPCLGHSLNQGNLFGFWEGLWLWNRWGSPWQVWMGRHQPRVLL